jgi:prepilin-type processing-associated H-X9-DG protein
MALDSPGWWWFNRLGMRSRDLFGRHPDALKCPSRPISQPALWYNLLYGNYGLNWSVCKGYSPDRRYAEFSGVPLASSRVVRASETLLLTDSGYALISWYHVTARPPFSMGSRKGVDLSYVPGLSANAGRTLLPSQQEDAFGGRHRSKTVNVGFVDAHVEHRSAETLAVSPVEDGYANLSPLWKPLGASAPPTGSVAP